jgi:hypothetical protein
MGTRLPPRPAPPLPLWLFLGAGVYAGRTLDAKRHPRTILQAKECPIRHTDFVRRHSFACRRGTILEGRLTQISDCLVTP